MDGEIEPDELADLLGYATRDDGDVDDPGVESTDEDTDDPGVESTDEDTDDPGVESTDEPATDRDDVQTGDVRIVDIRDRRAFDRGHVPDSECIPFPELTTRVPELDGASRIVTVCPHGIASRQAAQLIGSYAGTEAARVESLRGGLEAWERDIGTLIATEAAADGETDADANDTTDDHGPEPPF